MKAKKYLSHVLMVAGGIATVKVHQKFRHPLIKQSHAERLLEEVTLVKDIDWLKEASYRKDWQEKLEPFLDNKRKKGTVSSGVYHLNYEYYTLKRPIATCIIVHGFNEFKEKYRELIYYLLQADIQVLSYDARGHGDSKLSLNQTQIDVSDFSVYIADIDLMVKEAQKVFNWQESIYLFGHSMGGAVATRYSQIYPENVKGLILSAPMLAIYTNGWPMELAHISARLMQIFGRGKNYLPSNSDPETDQYFVFSMSNKLSNSEARGRFFFDLNRKLHRYPTHSGSYNWLKTSLDILQLIHHKSELRKITCPSLIFRAGADKVVKKEGLFNLYENLDHSHNFLVPASEHEILSGHDGQVKMIVSQVINFVWQNSEPN